MIKSYQRDRGGGIGSSHSNRERRVLKYEWRGEKTDRDGRKYTRRSTTISRHHPTPTPTSHLTSLLILYISKTVSFSTVLLCFSSLCFISAQSTGLCRLLAGRRVAISGPSFGTTNGESSRYFNKAVSKQRRRKSNATLTYALWWRRFSLALRASPTGVPPRDSLALLFCLRWQAQGTRVRWPRNTRKKTVRFKFRIPSVQLVPRLSRPPLTYILINTYAETLPLVRL